MSLKIFKEEFDLSITCETNLKAVNFLDVTLNLTTAKYQSYDKPETQEIIVAGEPLNYNVNILYCGKRRTCEFVQDVLLGNVKPPLNNYFAVANTKANTRNKNLFVHVPKVKLEYGKRSIRFIRAKIFNDLPINIRKKYKDTNFKDLLKKHKFYIILQFDDVLRNQRCL